MEIKSDPEAIHTHAIQSLTPQTGGDQRAHSRTAPLLFLHWLARFISRRYQLLRQAGGESRRCLAPEHETWSHLSVGLVTLHKLMISQHHWIFLFFVDGAERRMLPYGNFYIWIVPRKLRRPVGTVDLTTSGLCCAINVI